MLKQVMKQLCSAIWPTNTRLKDVAILKERDIPPSHYLLRIENFRELSENMFSNLILSNKFEAGGCKWDLHIYLNGDEENDGEGYISMYLVLADTDLPLGSEVNAIFNFFIYDQIQDKYLCLQDARQKHFHWMNTRWGVTKFIDLETFKNPSKGYLVNDSCTFGAEVFIIKNSWKGECLKMMIREPEFSCKYTWKFDDFSSKIRDEWYHSDTFIGGDYKWRIRLNPKPKVDAHNLETISVGLELDTSVLPPKTKLFANYVLRLVDQTEAEDHLEVEGTGIFFSSSYDYGDRSSDEDMNSFEICDFMSLVRLQDPKTGYLLDDKCIIEAEIDVLASKSRYQPSYY